MQNLEITIPKGYVIDEEKSSFNKIIFKLKEDLYPNSVFDIENREWYISNKGEIVKNVNTNDINDLSSEERAKEILALIQLLELRDKFNKIDEIDKSNKVYMIRYDREDKIIEKSKHCYPLCESNFILSFYKESSRNLFFERFENLIETAKNLI